MNLVLTRGREGIQNPENLADVICERPLIVMPGPVWLLLSLTKPRARWPYRRACMGVRSTS